MTDPRAVLDDPDDLEAWRSATEISVPFSDALDLWADAAHDALTEVARRYGAYITNAELAARAQADTGTVTRAPVRLWIAALQRRVSDRCRNADEPPLVSLMVGHDQRVGDGYRYAVEIAGLPVPADINEHAAAARLACYLHFGAAVPAGAAPALPPKLEQIRLAEQAKRDRARPASGKVVKPRAASAPRARATTPSKPQPAPPKLCPNCFTELSVAGTCGYC